MQNRLPLFPFLLMTGCSTIERHPSSIAPQEPLSCSKVFLRINNVKTYYSKIFSFKPKFDLEKFDRLVSFYKNKLQENPISNISLESVEEKLAYLEAIAILKHEELSSSILAEFVTRQNRSLINWAKKSIDSSGSISRKKINELFNIIYLAERKALTGFSGLKHFQYQSWNVELDSISRHRLEAELLKSDLYEGLSKLNLLKSDSMWSRIIFKLKGASLLGYFGIANLQLIQSSLLPLFVPKIKSIAGHTYRITVQDFLSHTNAYGLDEALLKYKEFSSQRVKLELLLDYSRSVYITFAGTISAWTVYQYINNLNESFQDSGFQEINNLMTRADLEDLVIKTWIENLEELNARKATSEEIETFKTLAFRLNLKQLQENLAE